MQDKPVLYVVGTKCPSGFDEKFNNWYNDTHIPMLLKSRYVTGATRYQVAPLIERETPPYLALYEYQDRQAFEAWCSSPERAAAGVERNETWRENNFETIWRAVCEPFKTWHK